MHVVRPYFQKLLRSSNFQNIAKIVSECTVVRPYFQSYSVIPTSKTSLQIVSECTVVRPYFQKLLCSSNFQNIASNSAKMHRCAS